MKKTFIKITALLCTAVCAVSMSACSGKSTLLASPATPESLSYEQRTDGGFVDFRQKIDGFASKFAAAAYEANGGDDNFAVSPVSLIMALSLAAECADGVTREELLSALGVSYEELKENISLLYSLLNSEYYVETYFGEKLQSKLQLGNSIWLQEGVSFKQDCLDSLAEFYYSYSYAADFIGDNANANRAVRSFVKNQTNGLIDKDFNISDETFFTLINTLYLKDVWNVDGDDISFTSDAYDFTNKDGSVKNQKLLQGYYNMGRAYQEEGFSAFYTTTQHYYKIKFIVPNDGYTIDEVFTAENIAKVNSISDFDTYDDENMLCYNTRCFFPEYKASCDNDVADLLKEKFGITSLFEIGNCDFGNLTDENVCCGGVKHVTNLTVNKTGIEGAAATVIPMAGSPGPGEYTNVYENFVVDRAFGFIITDSYGVALFSGVVNKI